MLIISIGKTFAKDKAKAVLPVAVAPIMAKMGFILFYLYSEKQRIITFQAA